MAGIKKPSKQVIGWREWVSLPDLPISRIKAKVDTGARSSSLHAFDMEIHRDSGIDYITFKVYPEQRSRKNVALCRAEIIEFRKVKSSNGRSENRPVIVSNLEMLGKIWPIELTLTNRVEMGFRMLLGRESFRNRFLVDAGHSYYGQKLKTSKEET